tara:strand:+ start:271 stop:372 length:102 start_codon:yes stop_codon:yes gene_type:complete
MNKGSVVQDIIEIVFIIALFYGAITIINHVVRG